MIFFQQYPKDGIYMAVEQSPYSRLSVKALFIIHAKRLSLTPQHFNEQKVS